MDKRMILPPTFSHPSCMTVFTHDASEDFTLPEYMPPIRHIVSVRATALPESRFIGGAALELGGTLTFSVLYVGEDGTLFCAPLTSEYTASCAIGEGCVADASRIGIDTAVETVSCRVSAPRALTLRTRMKTRLTAIENRAMEERRYDTAGARLTTADETSIERRLLEAHGVILSGGEVTASANGTLPIGADTRVICATGAVRVEEVHSAENAAVVRGEALLHLLLRTPDGTITTMSAKAPIAETVTVPGAEEGDLSRAWGRAASVTIQPGEGVCNWEIEYDLEAECARESVISYTADAYSTACACEVSQEEAESMTLLRCGVQGLSVSGEGGRQSRVASGERIADVSATATADHWEARDGALTLHGTAAVSVLILAEGDAVCEEFTVPFRCEMPLSTHATEELCTRCAIEVLSATGRTEGDRLLVQLEMCISALVVGRERVRTVSAITLDRTAPHQRRDGVIRITYPEVGESMWALARRYAVPRELLGETEYADGTPMIV